MPGPKPTSTGGSAMRYRRGTVTAQTALLAAAALIGGGIAPASAIDWSAVQGKEIVLFYPGQASWEWVLTESDHSAAGEIREGKGCADCHLGEEREIGNLIVSGEKLEPEPIEGKPGSIPMQVQTAFDDERFYVRMQWPDTGFVGPKEDAEHLIKANFMLNDQTLPAFRLGGCWATCHADLEGMPHDLPDVDLTKYLARSRTQVTRTGGGTNYKPDDELADMLAQGMFIDFAQAEIGEGGQPVEGEEGYILAERHESDDPAVSAEAELADGIWTVVLSRPLSGAGAGDKALEPGTTYTMGFAVHDGWADGRHHYVSLENTLVLGEGDADLVATRQ